MKWNSVWVLTGLMTLGLPFSIEALAVVESRTGEPFVAASEPEFVARSEDRTTSASKAMINTPAEDRAALLGLKQVETLKQEISELRGLVETQAHEIQQLKKSQQDFYTDLDKRITQSAKATPASKAASKTLVVVPSTTTKKSSVTIVPTGAVSTPDPIVSTEEERVKELAVSEVSDSTLTPNKKDKMDHSNEKATYEAAYNLVKAKRYSDATLAFQNYLTQFKTGEHAANAHYWIGEICMVEWQQDLKNKALLDKAANAFSSVASQFPGNPKVPDALLKLGIVENEKGNVIAARKHFTDVKNRYPGSAAARIAETRLKQL